MKQYFEYMDNVKVSDTLHQRLLELDVPKKQKHFSGWNKYNGVAAALVVALLTGSVLYAATRPEPLSPEVEYEKEDPGRPDIAIVEPGGVAEPGMKTIGGYEVTDGEMTSYFMLPYIEYGPPSGASADRSLAPPDGGLRGATRDDALALVGGEDALKAHLNWGDCEFDGTVGFESDGTVWMMSLWGENEDTAFSLQLSPNRLPPTCCVAIGEPRTVTNVWGVEVSGVSNAGAYGDTERGVYMDVSREVEFIANGVGCRLKAYGTQDGAVEELVSRFVRWAILEGLDLSGISSDGVMPQEIDPNYGVGEPNYEPNWSDSVDGQDADTPAYDPREAAGPSCNAPGTGAAE